MARYGYIRRVIVPFPTFALFAAAAAALIVTPGPAVLFIVARSLHQGPRAGVVSALGVATGGLVHVAAAVFGLSALLASSATAYATVRWFGAGYLVFLGVRTLVRRDSGPIAVGAPVPPGRLYSQGFVVNLLNPKTALFFLAFLPQFVDPARGPVSRQMLLLGITFVAMAVVSDTVYAMLAGSIGKRLGRTVAARSRARWLSGGLYIALGVSAAVGGRRNAN